jgi:pilus assembly protein Flp/PilA
MLSVTSFIAGVKTRLTKEEKGATMVEYGIMVAGIAVLVMGAVFLLGGRVDTLFDGITFNAPANP